VQAVQQTTTTAQPQTAAYHQQKTTFKTYVIHRLQFVFVSTRWAHYR